MWFGGFFCPPVPESWLSTLNRPLPTDMTDSGIGVKRSRRGFLDRLVKLLYRSSLSQMLEEERPS